jgi:adenylate cyclase
LSATRHCAPTVANIAVSYNGGRISALSKAVSRPGTTGALAPAVGGEAGIGRRDGGGAMGETRKLAAILVSDVVGYSRLAGADEDRILARLRTLRSDLLDPTVAVHHGRFVKRTGDGAIIEFRSVVDAVRCAIEVQNGMGERNAGVPDDQKIQFRVGIHLGDVVEESDGDLMGDGVNIAARLQSIAQPGAICLSEDAYRQVKQRLDLKVSDLGPTPLKNIAEPIHVYALEVGGPAVAKTGVVAAPEKSAPPRLSIVVLPFTNLGGDPEQEYFVDGVTENLTTDLSRIRGAFVIARNTAFTFKGKPIDVKKLGRDLNVRYVLEGSIQRGADRVRVNVQLIDAETDHHLWGERFDKPVVDLFDMQDEIVARLANTLNAELTAAEAGRAERSSNPDSMDFYFQGKAWLDRGRSGETIKTAREFFEKAIVIDANNGQALAGLAFSYAIDFQLRRFADVDYESKVFGLADRALALDRENILAYLAKGWYLIGCLRHGDARRSADAGLALDANSAALFSLRSLSNSYLGQFEQAKSDIQTAMRLSPRDPAFTQWRNFLADAELGLGHLDAAIEESSMAIEGGYRPFFSYLNLAAARALKGDVEDAKKALAQARRINPRLSVKWLREQKPILQPAFDSLREAGLPEE